MTLVVPQTGIVGVAGRSLTAVKNPAFDEELYTKEDTFKILGDLKDIEILFNDVLVAKYIRTRVSEHIEAAPETQREDVYQGVVGLVLKIGPTAFVDDEHTVFPVQKWDRPIAVGDWVLYRSSDGWDKDIAPVEGILAVKCRMIQDAHIRGRVKFPGRLL